MAFFDLKGYLLWLDETLKGYGNVPYLSPAPKGNNNYKGPIFPILFSGIKYNRNNQTLISVNEFGEAKDAGFNVCLFGSTNFGNPELVKEILKNAESVKIRLTMREDYFINFFDSIEKVARKFNFNEEEFALGGIGFADEPSYRDMMGQTLYSNYSEGKNFLESYSVLLPQLLDAWKENNLSQYAIVNINLIGFPQEEFMRGIPGYDTKESDPNYKEIMNQVYRKYVETFQTNFRPSFFSYDYYPVEETANLIYQGIFNNSAQDSSKEGEIKIGDRNITNFEIFKEMSEKYDRPFWKVCQGQSYFSLTSLSYRPIAKEQFLRSDIFLALAFGAKGINYWTYATSVNPENGSECYMSALLDRKGRKTASWYYAKRVNDEIQRYSDIFLNSTLLDVKLYRTGEKENFEILGSKFTFTIGNGEGVFISRMRKISSNFIIIVNSSPLYYQDFSINLTSGTITQLTPTTSKGTRNTTLRNGVTNITLIPGGYHIFQIF